METVEFIKLFKDLKFTGGISAENISSAEGTLNLKFSNEYKLILKELGATRFNGIELNGLTNAPSLNVVEETRIFKELANISNDLYVISSLGIDFVKIMQNEKGEIFQGSSSKVKKIANSIFDYLLLDVRKNINVESVIDFLGKLNISKYDYCIGYSEFARCIEQVEDKWIIYTAERGNRSFVKTFENEYDACNEFLIENIKYGITHKVG